MGKPKPKAVKEPSPPKAPWEKHNPRSVKRNVFNIRINTYYHEALRHFSNPEEGISMQQVARQLLQKGLDELIDKNKKK